MMTTSTQARGAFITGLLNLAFYLHAHQDVPVPVYGTEILVGARDVEDGGITEVENTAAALAAHVDRTKTGGYETCRSFGPVGYKIYALSKASIARHEAETSYRGCVTPADA